MRTLTPLIALATQAHKNTVVQTELHGATLHTVRLIPEKKSASMWITWRAAVPRDECRADPATLVLGICTHSVVHHFMCY